MIFNQRFNRSLQGLLLGICFILVAILCIGLFRDYDLDPGVAETEVESQSMNTIDIQLPPLTSYAQVIERPLFAETRRPYIPEVIVEKETPVQQKRQPEEAFFLSGIIINGSQRLALIEMQQSKKIESLKEGALFTGWTVSEILPTQVRLIKGTEERVLELEIKSSPSKQRGRIIANKTNEPPQAEIVDGTPEIIEAISSDE